MAAALARFAPQALEFAQKNPDITAAALQSFAGKGSQGDGSKAGLGNLLGATVANNSGDTGGQGGTPGLGDLLNAVAANRGEVGEQQNTLATQSTESATDVYVKLKAAGMCDKDARALAGFPAASSGGGKRKKTKKPKKKRSKKTLRRKRVVKTV